MVWVHARIHKIRHIIIQHGRQNNVVVITYVMVLIATSYKEYKHIIIQHGRQNNVVVIMYVMVLIATSYKENKTCGGGKKRRRVKNL